MQQVHNHNTLYPVKVVTTCCDHATAIINSDNNNNKKKKKKIYIYIYIYIYVYIHIYILTRSSESAENHFALNLISHKGDNTSKNNTCLQDENTYTSSKILNT